MAYGDYNRTTEIEAVNTCLGVIGEQPVSAVTEGPNKASLARDLIYSISRRVQTEGLNCNTEITTLSPNVDDEIELPANCIDVEPVHLADGSYVERNGKLYDRINNTYTITSPVEVKLSYFLPWEQLPEHVRNYVSIVAARIFQTRYVSDTNLHQFTEADEAKAHSKFVHKELDGADLQGTQTAEVYERTQEDEVVDLCMTAIGERAANSVTGHPNMKAEIARKLLEYESQSIQASGLVCNTSRKVEIEPDESGHIVLPDNTLFADPYYASDNKYVERNGKLYDQEDHTYVVDKSIEVDIVYYLPFSELPEHVRQFVKISTVRKFQKRFLGGKIGDGNLMFTKEDEYRARAEFKRNELLARDVSIIDNTRVNPRFYRGGY